MKNLSNNILNSFIKLKKKLSPELAKALNGITSKGEEVTALSKNKIELEKARLDLKRKYREMGSYVSSQYDLNKVTDFSEDVDYIKMLNELKNSKTLVNKIKEERKKIRGG